MGEEGITRVNNPESFACTCSVPSALAHHGPLCQHTLLHASRSHREIIHCFLVSFLLGNDEYISPLVWKCTEASFSTIWIDSYSTFLYIIHTAAFRRPSPHVPSLDGDPDSFCRFLLGEKTVNNRVNKKKGRPNFYKAFTLFLSTHQCVTVHSCHNSFLYTKLIPHHFKQSLEMVDTCNPGQKWAD